MDNFINILHIVKAYRGNYPLLNQITNMDKNIFQSHVCYLTGNDDGNNLIVDQGTQTYYLHSKGKLHPYRLDIAKQLGQLIDSINANFVIAHLEKTIHLSALSSYFSKTHSSYIGVIHGVVGADHLPLNKQLRNWLAFKRMDKIVSVSKSGVKDIIDQNWALPEDKVFSIQNGIDIATLIERSKSKDSSTLLPPHMKDCFVFATVGRLAAKKNQSLLLKAFSEVSKIRDDARLMIMGTGPLENSLKALVEELGIEDRIWFTGHRDDVPSLLSLIDVFVFPSFREGLPLSLLEAMALSKPCIASDIPCNREVIQSDSIGRLASPEQVDKWIEYMLEFSRMPQQQLQHIGHNAFIRIQEQFSDRRMTQDYENLIHSLDVHNLSSNRIDE